jgi:hypothetical protein
MKKVLGILWLGLLLGAMHLHGQPPKVPVAREKLPTVVARTYLGLDLWDAAHRGLNVCGSYRPGERIEVSASLGYSLWRKYGYMSTVRDQVHGLYGGVGVQWRLWAEEAGAWLLGARITLGSFGHKAVATIPNYYGDVVERYAFATGYLAPQVLMGRSYIWRRWRLDAGLRLSLCPAQYGGEITYHSYLPGLGRVNMWSREQTHRPFITTYPFVRLSVALD